MKREKILTLSFIRLHPERSNDCSLLQGRDALPTVPPSQEMPSSFTKKIFFEVYMTQNELTFKKKKEGRKEKYR